MKQLKHSNERSINRLLSDDIYENDNPYNEVNTYAYEESGIEREENF